MPKLKLKFDRQAVAGFFVTHVEKVVLAGVLLLFMTFVYTGFSVEGLPSERNPVDLAEKTSSAKQRLDVDNWSEISLAFTPETGLEERVREAVRNPTRALVYAPTKPYVPETKSSGLKRADPEMLAPIEVEASVIVGPLAIRMVDQAVDKLDQLEDTEMLVKKTRKKRKRRGGRMTQEELDQSFGVEVETNDDPFAQISGGGPDIFGQEEDGKSPASAADRTFPGYRPDGEATPLSTVMVVVKALVLVQKQWDIFDQTLAGAMHYNKFRDTPKYLAYEAQRAEVVTGAPDEELIWRPASSTGGVQQGLSRIAWTGLAGEIADRRYVDDRLTMPIPPIMMRRSADFALHSKVPRVLKSAAVVQDYFAETDVATTVFNLGAVDMASAVAVPIEPDSGEPSNDAVEANQGSGPFGAFGSGPMSPAGGPSSGSIMPGPSADYFLVRCFDDGVQPGKKYRYRVRVYIEDPNRPAVVGLRPQERSLDESVKTRLAAAGEDYPGYISTEWSDASDVITVSMPRETIAGPINPFRSNLVPNTAMSIPAKEPSAKILSLVYDRDYDADVPAFQESYRGTYLDFVKDADVVHPVTLAFKKLKRYAFKTDRMLVDFRGGEVLPEIKIENEEEDAKSDDDEVVAPDIYSTSEYIFLDLNGNFFVRNDLDDQDTFGLYVVPEKEEE